MNIKALFAYALLAVGIGLLVCSYTVDVVKEDVPCYDRFSNVIKGAVCEGNAAETLATAYAGAGAIAIIIASFFIIILGWRYLK